MMNYRLPISVAILCGAFLNASHNELLLPQAQKLQSEGSYSQAIELYEQLFAGPYRTTQSYFSYAYCCTMMGEVRKAKIALSAILKQNSTCVPALYNLAYLLKMSGDIEEAIPLYRKAIEIDPNREETHFGLGMAHLVGGNFKDGWEIHTRYLKRTNRNAEQLRTLLKEGALTGKTILLRQEGGFGDVIQFVRYAKVLKDLGARTIVSVQKELYPLLANCDYIDVLLKTGDYIPEPYTDQTTLMSMPAIWYAHSETLVHEIPYIYPNPERVAYWAERLKDDAHFKIGICWGASIHNDSSRPPVARRSIPLAELSRLHTLPNVSLYSLQRFDGEEQLHDLPSNITIHTFGDDFDRSHGSFMDTVALMQHMDLIVSVDTATAHLAGALGRPVFIMLPYATDWRWIAHRTDSPWYPTMRIFKQQKPFDWSFVIDEIYAVLNEQLSEK